MDILVFFTGGGVIFWLAGAGLTIATTPVKTSHHYREFLPSSIVGSAFLAIVVTTFYKWGVAPSTTTAAVAFTGLFVCGFAIWRQGSSVQAWTQTCSQRLIFTRSVPLAVLAALLLLPHYFGGAEFSIFQGNRHDTINYLSGAFGYANYPFAYLSHFDLAKQPAAGLAEAANMLSARPTVSLLYASLYKLLSINFLRNAYEFCTLGQLNLYFALLYLLLCAFPERERRAQICAVALCVGFFGQYIFDINAWSQIYAVPVMIVLVTDYSRALLVWRELNAQGRLNDGGDAGDRSKILAFCLVRIPILAAGMFYVYPEIASVAGVACVAVLAAILATCISSGRRRMLACLIGISLGMVAVMALLSAGYWEGTVRFLLQQLKMASSTNVTWYNFFQAYLLGGTDTVAARLGSSSGLSWLFYTWLAVPANFLSGFLGLYPVQIQGVWTDPLTANRVLWSIGLLIWFGALVASVAVAVRTIRRDARTEGRMKLLVLILIGGVASWLVPVTLLLKGQLWAAGKGTSMVSPFIFLMIVLPVFVLPRRSVGVWVAGAVIAGHLLFGVARPINVATRTDGGLFQYPYPTLSPVYKTSVEWNVGQYAVDIAKCSVVRIDVDEPFLARVVENYVMELGRDWYSRLPQKSYYGDGFDLPARKPSRAGAGDECAITTVELSGIDSRTISLKR